RFSRDWSSDVCSSDLLCVFSSHLPVCFAKPAVVSVFVHPAVDVTKHKNLNLVWLDMLPLQYTFGVFEQCHPLEKAHGLPFVEHEIGRASCRERVSVSV